MRPAGAFDIEIGRRFRVGRAALLTQVVGVARDAKYMFVGEPPRAFFYLPLRQNYRGDMTLFVHSEGDSASVFSAVRQAVREMDKDLPVYDVKTMASHLRDGQAFLFTRLAAQLAGAFGLLGLALAVVGIYGLVSYTVARRRHEIGIRMALGADRRDVVAMVIRQGMVLATAGVVIGLAAAWGLTRFLQSLLYQVSATDPASFAIVSFALALVAAVASLVPARRGTKVDPMVALRCE